MPPPVIVNPRDIDTTHIVADLDAIRQISPQRYEWEQLTAIVLIDTDRKIIAGYKDLAEDEWWMRGHIPGRPLMPGVLMIEGAAQLCGYYFYRFLRGDRDGFLGFGSVDDVKFRGTVSPGSRLLSVGRMLKITRRTCQFEAQSFVENRMVFEARITGMIF